jgi:hypothetical protein
MEVKVTRDLLTVSVWYPYMDLSLITVKSRKFGVVKAWINNKAPWFKKQKVFSDSQVQKHFPELKDMLKINECKNMTIFITSIKQM